MKQPERQSEENEQFRISLLTKQKLGVEISQEGQCKMQMKQLIINE